MFTEFASVQLTREELKEIHAALVQRAVVEDDLRCERGQEPIERRPLLDSIEMLLNEREEKLHALDHELEDELWEYAWYAFTDEWAHARAAQDALREAGADPKKTDLTDLEKRIEIIYQKNFETYVAELAMDDGAKKKTVIRSPQDTLGSR